jgi:MFS family permease
MFTRYRKRTIVGITVQLSAQLNGINIISFYLPSTLATAGFDEKKSLLYTAANAILYTAATVVTWWLADRWGRKPLLLRGGVLMAVLLGIVCAFTEANMPISARANGQYAFIMLYNIVYGFTWGPMPWLLPAEIFPLRGRSKGMALATTSNWIVSSNDAKAVKLMLTLAVFQLHHRHGLSRCLCWNRRLLLPCYCGLLSFLGWTESLLLCRDGGT